MNSNCYQNEIQIQQLDKAHKPLSNKHIELPIGSAKSATGVQFDYKDLDNRSTYEDSKITNLSTLSPQKTHEIKEEPQRKLESQPIQSCGNPL